MDTQYAPENSDPERPSENVMTSLPDNVRRYIYSLETKVQYLTAQVTALNAQVTALSAQVAELLARLSKDSSNSSKPPSSDGFKKPEKTKSLREHSGKKPGGQPGHRGSTLIRVEHPDHIETHSPDVCKNCGNSLSEVLGTCVETRQVFDIPVPKIEVTEHRIENKRCPCCNTISIGIFPTNVAANVQYGERVCGLIAYLQHQHFVPVDRVCQILEDIFDAPISPGTCARVDKNLYEKLAAFEIKLKSHLISSKALHFDETGMRCNKTLSWIHVASSTLATFYGIHAKRGQVAIDEFNILPQFRGSAIHDHWHPYFSYDNVTHVLCNAHHLRELTFVHEEEKEEWAQDMKVLLIKIKEVVLAHNEVGKLPPELIDEFETEYKSILQKGFTYHQSLNPLPKNKRGRQKQRIGNNLLDRFALKQDCILKFMHNFSIPFTNNQGEQDIRMVKLKQKISGCFRTFEGGQIFCRIRSYISTARKQRWSIWDSLADAIKGSHRMLIESSA